MCYLRLRVQRGIDDGGGEGGGERREAEERLICARKSRNVEEQLRRRKDVWMSVAGAAWKERRLTPSKFGALS